SITCSPECKIVGQILLDHPLSYALTATADVLMDMFRDILHLPVETSENPFVTPINIEIIKAFMNRVGYQGVIDKMLIPDVFLIEEIRATNDFKEYDTVFINVVVPMNQPQPVVSTQERIGLHLEPIGHLSLLLVLKERRGSKLLENQVHHRNR
ncbi:hypothetical protein Tco_0057403, partial [Tanacetum coccineum]